MTPQEYQALSPAEKQKIMAASTPEEMALLFQAPKAQVRAKVISMEDEPKTTEYSPRIIKPAAPKSNQEQLFQILGCACFIVALMAIFLPEAHAPIFGSINLFNADKFASGCVLIFALGGIACVLLRSYFLAIIWSFVLAGGSAWQIQSILARLDDLSTEFSKEPDAFGRSLGEFAVKASGIDIGLPVLILMAILAAIFSGLAMRQKA